MEYSIVRGVRSLIIVGFTFAASLSYTLTSFAGELPTYRFINNDASARIAAIGGSGVALQHDPILIFYNPAGMYGMTQPHGALTYFRFVEDINFGFLAYAQPLQKYGWIGGGIAYMNSGNMQRTDHLGNVLGTFSSSDLAIIVSYANRLYGDNLSFGVSLKFFYSSLTPDHVSSAIGGDFGIQYYIPEQKLIIGFSILNLGRQIQAYANTREPLPLDLKLGISKGLEHLPLVLSLNFHHLNNNTENELDRLRNFTIGGEFTISEVFRLRIGYRNEMRQDLKIGSTIGLAGFTGGFGLHHRQYQFDYGFTSLGRIGSQHHLTVHYLFQ